MVAILLRKDTGVCFSDQKDLSDATRWQSIYRTTRSSIKPSASNFMGGIVPESSLSPRKRQGDGGTFGGWVKLRNPETGEWAPFGITCANCVWLIRK